MVATKKSGQYDAAIALPTDVRAIAEREGEADACTRKATALRERHTSKRAFIRRLATVGIGAWADTRGMVNPPRCSSQRRQRHRMSEYR